MVQHHHSRARTRSSGVRSRDRRSPVPVRPRARRGPKDRRRGAIRGGPKTRCRHRGRHHPRWPVGCGVDPDPASQGCPRPAAGDSLCARWRLGGREQPHPRPPGSRARRRDWRRGRIPQLQPLAGGALPDRDRGDLLGARVGRRARRGAGSRRRANRCRGRLGRRQHDRRVDADGQAALRAGPHGQVLFSR